MQTAETQKNGMIEELFQAGAHYGVARARRHPTTLPYIFTTKQGVDIFDLEKTVQLFEDAEVYMRSLGAERKKVLLVGGKPESQRIVRDAAERTGVSYVAGRWIGGTLTNFAEVKKRIARLEHLKKDKESGAHEKYTKLERLMIDREIERLERTFGGLVTMQEKLPDALVIIDPKREHIAVKEARALSIPVVALTSSDGDLSLVDQVVVANDASVKSITFVVKRLMDAYMDGLQNAPQEEAVKEEAAATT